MCSVISYCRNEPSLANCKLMACSNILKDILNNIFAFNRAGIPMSPFLINRIGIHHISGSANGLHSLLVRPDLLEPQGCTTCDNTFNIDFKLKRNHNLKKRFSPIKGL